MARIRVGGVTAATAPTVPRIRVGGVTAAGATPPATPRVRVGGITASGVVAVVLEPFEDRVVDPLSPQTITATLAPGSAVPDSYTWRRVEGANVPIIGAGATVSIDAPASFDGTYVVLGVKATKAGVDSVERRIRITTGPYGGLYQSTPGGWVPIPGLVPL